MPDADGYPTEAETETLKQKAQEWPKGDLMDYLRFLWWMPDWGFILTGKRVKRLQLHTGGWSGNETIIAVLRPTFFWMFTWQKSTRGGHYWFLWDEQLLKKGE